MVITGTGDTITGARRSAYAALGKVKIPNSPGWRPDIGKGKLVSNLPKIQKQGYALGLSF
jgi:phosphoribosylamine--glycine ligase